MAKDEKIWIPDNYYNGFLKVCMANEAIETTPSKTALENAGCEISALCYLILPNGDQHNPRFMKPNEFPTSIRALFEIAPDEGDPDEEPAPVDTVGQEIKDMLQEATYQVCDTCGENKPMEAFKKKPGRGVLRKSTCIECEAKAKEQTAPIEENTTPAPDPDRKPDPIEETVTSETKPPVMVTLEYLKKITTEAFERGREYERNSVETVELSLDELLVIGA